MSPFVAGPSGPSAPPEAARAVEVALGDRAYTVHVVPGAFDGLGAAVHALFGARPAVVVTDDRVGPLWAEALASELATVGVGCRRVVLPAGEVHKTLATWSLALDGLLAAGVDRRTPVVALGGGVVGDVAGFAAASALRGLPVVQVPTTLLAMVDSSVGGKTGVNHARGKNLIGAFHQPRLVWAGLQTLSTLAPRVRDAGLGEVLKTGLVADRALVDRLERGGGEAARSVAELGELVARCVAAKAAVVADDEREAGRRLILNAGHTVGHALEQVLGFGALEHGEAVAVGLVIETAWGEARGVSERGLAARVGGLVRGLGLPDPRRWAGREELVEPLVAAMQADKKADGDAVVVPVVKAPGEVVAVRAEAEALRALARALVRPAR